MFGSVGVTGVLGVTGGFVGVTGFGATDVLVDVFVDVGLTLGVTGFGVTGVTGVDVDDAVVVVSPGGVVPLEQA